jgi:hypothetical protein
MRTLVELTEPATTGKCSFVLVRNPHLYRVLNRYRFSGTNDGAHLYLARFLEQMPHICTGWNPAPVQMWFARLHSFLPPLFVFLFFCFLISSHLISYSSQNQKNNYTNTRFTSHLISSHKSISTTINFYTHIQLIYITIFHRAKN